MRVLVTGGAGFIGHHLVQRLLTRPEMRVTVLDDLSTGHTGNLPLSDRLDLVVGSVLTGHQLRSAMYEVDAVVHLAAIASVPISLQQPELVHDVNATGTLKVLEMARALGVKKVILASSAAVYGQQASNEESMPPRPISPYGASKVAAEAYALAYTHHHRIQTYIMRLFNVYGPGQRADHPYAPVIGRFVDQALAHKPLTIHGDGTQRREFVHVYTVCDLIARLLSESYGWSGPVNVAFGQINSLLGVAQTLGSVLGRELDLEFLPPRPGDIYTSGATGHMLTLATGRPQGPALSLVDLREGLASMIPRELVRSGPR